MLLTTRQMAGVVLHPVAVTHLAQHLQVVLGVAPASGPQQLAFGLSTSNRSRNSERMALMAESNLSLGVTKCFAGRCSPTPCSGGSRRWGRHNGSPPPHRRTARSAPTGLRRRGLQHILHPEATARDLGVVSAVLVVNQFPQLASDVEGLTHLELHRRFEVLTWNPKAVDTADRGHHDHVAPFEQRPRRR